MLRMSDRALRALGVIGLVLLGLWVAGQAWGQTASLLPNGKQQYTDANGVPLANGTVCYYIPNTLIAKTTWLDPLQVTPNASPCVSLDAAGRAIVYGSGQYRQQVFDQFSDLVWDQLTGDPIALLGSGSAGTFFSFPGSTVGAANAQVVTSTVPVGFALTVGNQLNFVAGFTNTAAVTLNTSGTGVFSVLKRASSGLVPLVAGDLVLGSAYSATWDGTEYQLLNGGWQSGFATIASAGTTNICALGNPYVQVTGTTTITAFDASCPAGTIIGLEFTGVLTLTQGTNLQLPAGGSNITTAAGTTALVAAEPSGVWRVLSLTQASGNSITGAAAGDLAGTYPNPSVSTFNTGQGIWSTGDVKATIKLTADAGWVLLNDGTIGDAASGATTLASASTSALFTLLWTDCAQANCVVAGGRGASAAADFAANKTIALPKMQSRVLGSAGAGSGLSSRVLGSSGGTEASAIAQANLPAVNWPVTDPGHFHVVTGAATAGGTELPATSASTTGGATFNTNLATTGISVASGGSGTPLPIIQPTTWLNFEMKL
jgi:hypothetical protein